MKTCIIKGIQKVLLNSIIVILYLVYLFPVKLLAQDTTVVFLDPFYSQKEMIDFKMRFLHSGDDWSYKEYMRYNYDYKQFAYALLMANKYDNIRACYYVYWCLVEDLYERYGIDVDTATYNLVLPYLEKGAGQGNANCEYQFSYLMSSKRPYEQDSLRGKLKKLNKNHQVNNRIDDNDQILKMVKGGEDQALNDYLSNNNGVDVLPLAVLMANRYNNGYACYLVYYIIVNELFAKNNIEIDSTNFSIAISFLNKGASYGSYECFSELSTLYKNGIYYPKDLKKAEEYEIKRINVKQKSINENYRSINTNSSME